MNLHGITAGAVGVVNPFTLATVKVNNGSTTNSDGSRSPSYNIYPGRSVQVQPLSQKDLRQIDGLNLQGTLRAIYITGPLDGIVRVANKGGDLIELSCGPNAGTWLVNQVLEAWPDWTKVVATLQNGS